MKFASLVEIPNDKKTLDLALSFEKLALYDAQAADKLYKVKLYGLSIYHVQQSIEKSAKSFGLLTSVIKPEDVKNDVGHNSLLVVLKYLQKNTSKVILLLDELFSSSNEIPLFSKIIELMMNKNQIRTIIDGLKKQEDEKVYEKLIKKIQEPATYKEMWEATLNLNKNKDIVSSALNDLQTKDKILKLSTMLFDILKKIPSAKVTPKESIKLKITFIIIEVAPLLLDLASLTIWHEKETRYPPISKQDYWNPFEYKEEKPLITILDKLADKSKDLSNSIINLINLANEYISVS